MTKLFRLFDTVSFLFIICSCSHEHKGFICVHSTPYSFTLAHSSLCTVQESIKLCTPFKRRPAALVVDLFLFFRFLLPVERRAVSLEWAAVTRHHDNKTGMHTAPSAGLPTMRSGSNGWCLGSEPASRGLTQRHTQLVSLSPVRRSV